MSALSSFEFLGQFPVVQRARAGNAYSESVSTWVHRLPELFDRLCERWSFIPERALLGGQLGVVVSGNDAASHEPRVLKLSCPNVETRREIQALRNDGGRSTPVVYRSNLREAAVLMEELGPPLAASRHRTADHELLTCLRAAQRYWQPRADGRITAYMTTERFRREYAGCHRQLTGFLCDNEAEMMIEYSRPNDSDMREAVTLVGDPHAQNLLRTYDGQFKWIDLTGWTGPRAFDAGKMLALSWGGEDRERASSGDELQRRSIMLADAAQLRREEVIRWMIVHRYSTALWLCMQRETTWATAIRDGTRNACEHLRNDTLNQNDVCVGL